MEKDNRLSIWLKDRWFIVVVLLFSVFVRIYKIDFNLPELYWHDENNYAETALRFGTGNFRPHTFAHGMTLPLILFAEYAIYYILKAITIRGYGHAYFLAEYVTNPTNFYLIGRMTAALFGIGCILLVYLIALRLYNKRCANIASFLFSLSLVPLIESRYTKAEPIAAFFLLAAFLTAIPIFDIPRGGERKQLIRHYILAAFFIGLATAVKLHAVFGVSFLVLAHLFSYRNVLRPSAYFKHLGSSKMIFAGLFFIIGFVLGNPYILADPRFFYDSITQMQRELFNPNIGIPWAVYFKYHLKNVVGSRPLEILILIGCAFFILKCSKKAILLMAYPAAFYLMYMHYFGFAHYLIPAVPFLLIISAAFLDNIFSKNSFRRFFSVILIIIVTASPSFLNMMRYLALVSRPDTRVVAKDWIEKNIPRNSSILSEGYISTIAIHVPQIKGNLATLTRDIVSIKAANGKGEIKEAEIEYAKKDTRDIRYNVFKTAMMDADILKKTKADYVILSSFMDDMDTGEREYLREGDFHIKRLAMYRELEKDYRLLEKICPYPELSFTFPVFLIDDFKKLESIDLLKDVPRLRAGPEIKIFCRKNGQ